MKLATLKDDSRDGTLIVVNQTLTRAVAVPEIATTMQQALDNWAEVEPQLQEIYVGLNHSQVSNAFDFDASKVHSPLPRAYQWLDGSAYLAHVERVRKARGAEMPPSFLHDPLMYQGGSDNFLAPQSPIVAEDASWGIDCEAEIVVVTDDVPMATKKDTAKSHIKLLMLVNDVSLRNLIPAELAKGFGFVQSKPSSAFSPVAITPDELGDAWQNTKVHLPLNTWINNEPLGAPNAGDDMQFGFAELIEHAAKTRPLGAGTLIGSGTVANQDKSTGCSCLAEKRVVEVVEQGEAITPFLQFGDTVKIEMFDADGQNLFGTIEQKVTPVD